MINSTKPTLHLLAGSVAILALSSPAAAKDGVKAGTDGMTLTAAGGALEFNLGGRLHLDAITYDDSVNDFDDGDVRRARLELSGKIADIIRFRIDREFADTDGWRNLWASIEPVDGLEIKGGNYSVPFAMEDLQSSNRIALMERSLVTALTPGFSVGGGLQVSQRHWTLAAGYFGDAIDNEDERADERGKGFAGRVTVAPINGKKGLVHFGAAVEDRSFSTGEVARFQTKAGSKLAPTLLGTGGIIDPDHLTNIGGEVALSRGPLLVQGEYVATKLTRTASPTLNFDGWYAQANWVVTGQRYDYSRRAGIVSGVDLKPGKGAVELAARYAELDLNDDAFALGLGSALTFGANWYLNQNVRLMANYVHSKVQDIVGQPDRKADLFAARFQVSF